MENGIYYQDNHIKIYNKDCRDMSELAGNSVQCVVTSPPYWGLRKYSGEQELIWGDNNCEHQWVDKEHKDTRGIEGSNLTGRIPYKEGEARINYKDGFCSLCGAWKGAYGLEPTPEMYVEHTIEILREIRRVLRKDGVVFWNIGDSYSATRWSNTPSTSFNPPAADIVLQKQTNLPPKNLCLIPFRVAIAAQEDGWWVRSVIIWSKPNPMPESVTDRPTESHEYILMLTKSARYYWDADAVREPNLPQSIERAKHAWKQHKTNDMVAIHNVDTDVMGERFVPEAGRNIRSVWEFNGDGQQGGNFYSVLQGCPIHSPLLHPEILKMVSDGEPQDCLLTHTLDKYNCLVPVLSSSLSSKIFHTSGDAHLSKLGFHHHETSLWQIAESIGDNRKLALCYPDGGHLSYPETISHTKHTGTSDGLLACSSDYSRLADELIATLRNKEIRRIVSLIVVNDNAFLQCPDRTAHTLQSLGCICSYNYNNISHFPLSSIWSFSTQPFKEAHFAVFPEKLPEVCIKAATPEVGCCSKCGAPWERVTENKPMEIRRTDWGDKAGNRTASSGTMISSPETTTLGWQPTCKCNADKVPSLVLDPFMGAGTTLWVAKKLNRQAVGYEISQEYCELALDRNRQQVLI